VAYLSADEIRTLVARTATVDPFGEYTDEDLDKLAGEFKGTVERYLGCAQEPTTTTEIVDLTAPAKEIVLAWPKIRSITSVTVAGVTLAATAYRPRLASGLLVRVGGCWDHEHPPTVVYVHGADAPSEGLERACALYVASVAVAEQSGTSRDIITQGIDGGTTRYSTPNFDEGRPTGWLEVDRLINAEAGFKIPGIG
jgi:NaMN:DMB phosphoribosyltransferase